MATGPYRVLVVDDEPAVCALIQDELRRQGYECTVATKPEQAIGLLDGDAFDLILADISMPRLSGLDVLVCAKRKAPDCRVVLITAHGTRDHIGQALFLGAFDSVEKPFGAGELLSVLSRALHDKSQLSALSRRAANAMEFQDQAARASLDSVLALVRAAEAKDAYTRRHSEQVAHYARSIAETLGLPARLMERIRIAALLHDVGKIGNESFVGPDGPAKTERRTLARPQPGPMAGLAAVVARWPHQNSAGSSKKKLDLTGRALQQWGKALTSCGAFGLSKRLSSRSSSLKSESSKRWSFQFPKSVQTTSRAGSGNRPGQPTD